MNVIVIGGGASGLISAIYASSNNNVTILEKNKTLGKKLLITGNGKCNYWNSDINTSNYRTDDIDMLEKIISTNNKEEILNFFDSIGIIPKIKNGYYYPYSNISVSVLNALLLKIRETNINVVTDVEVLDITKKDKFIVKTTKGDYTSDKLIISTGSYSAPKTGSDGIGYKILHKFKHKIIPVYPALVGLICDESYLINWAGIRVDGTVTLYSNNKAIVSYTGELQLNADGISGIPVMNLSGRANKLNNIEIGIDFLPNYIDINYIDKRNNSIKNRTIIELLEGIINYKLLYIILKKTHINVDTKWDQLTNEQKLLLFSNLRDFRVKIIGSRDYEYSQVCTGGISLKEIKDTMESTLVDNLYIVGELLNIDGDCGGYNLAIAWLTGMIAGKNI